MRTAECLQRNPVFIKGFQLTLSDVLVYWLLTLSDVLVAQETLIHLFVYVKDVSIRTGNFLQESSQINPVFTKAFVPIFGVYWFYGNKSSSESFQKYTFSLDFLLNGIPFGAQNQFEKWKYNPILISFIKTEWSIYMYERKTSKKTDVIECSGLLQFTH